MGGDAVPKHPLASRTDLELIELAEAPFILYPRKNGSLLYDKYYYIMS